MHMPRVAQMEGGIGSNKEEVVVVIKIIEVMREMMGHKPSIEVISFFTSRSSTWRSRTRS